MEAEDVVAVVYTHVDGLGVGLLADGSPTFPDARYLVPRLELEALRDLADMMSGGSDEDARRRYSAFARQDAVFHDRILEFAGNELIRHTLAHQHTHFHIFRLMFHARVTEEALTEHQALLDAFTSADGAAAKAAMHDHIARSRQRLLPAFDL